jgi:16S rRNA (guanine527-N7)-methyltransferase
MEETVLLKEATKQIGVNITDKNIEDFIKYKDFLISYNKNVNLTAITDSKEIMLKHFVDSLTISKYINHNDNVIDVGTGAGFPTVPIKIVNNDINLTLLDSLNKRITFLKELTSILNLNNVTSLHSRAEEAGQNPLYREKYDVATSRAVAKLSVLAEYCLPFVKVGGKFISMKGPDVSLEIFESKKALRILGGEVIEVIEVKIPFSDITHSIVIVNKISQTPMVYPRKAGKASKSPIKGQ